MKIWRLEQGHGEHLSEGNCDGDIEVVVAPEVEVRVVNGTYEHQDQKSRVLCAPEVSGEFNINVGLRQESSVSPLLLIAVVELRRR